MSAEVWGVIAAFAGVGAAFLAVFVGAFFWLLSALQKFGLEIRTEMRALRTELRAEIGELRTELRTDIRELQADNQRFFEAFYRHRHDAEGSIYVPADDD